MWPEGQSILTRGCLFSVLSEKERQQEVQKQGRWKRKRKRERQKEGQWERERETERGEEKKRQSQVDEWKREKKRKSTAGRQSRERERQGDPARDTERGKNRGVERKQGPINWSMSSFSLVDTVTPFAFAQLSPYWSESERCWWPSSGNVRQDKKGKILTFQFWWDKVVRLCSAPPLADNVTLTRLRWKRRRYHSGLVFQIQRILYGEGGDLAAADTEETTTLTWAVGGVEGETMKARAQDREDGSCDLELKAPLSCHTCL